MMRPFIYLHWKQVRLGLLPLSLAAFALPLLSVQGLGATRSGVTAVYEALSLTQVWLGVFPGLALVVGITLALSAWNWDHQGGHVYALSLPLSRWEYATLKMGAGVVLALVPAAAFWLGSRVAVASVDVPPTLHAYPDQLAMRFLLAVLVSYSALFALAAGTMRTAVWVLSGAMVLLFGAFILNDVLGAYDVFNGGQNPVLWFLERLVRTGGPLEIFTGNWTLIDV